MQSHPVVSVSRLPSLQQDISLMNLIAEGLIYAGEEIVLSVVHGINERHGSFVSSFVLFRTSFDISLHFLCSKQKIKSFVAMMSVNKMLRYNLKNLNSSTRLLPKIQNISHRSMTCLFNLLFNENFYLLISVL